MLQSLEFYTNTNQFGMPQNIFIISKGPANGLEQMTWADFTNILLRLKFFLVKLTLTDNTKLWLWTETVKDEEAGSDMEMEMGWDRRWDRDALT